ncbi:MAG: hypothetical protein HYU99_02785 [Deltaproteobacteria bacterium]|nr:hypothetical protein [Deltaproteobacteria bacterium]
MKLSEFRKKMVKPCFTLAEAHRVGWRTSLGQLTLQLHQWGRRGEILRLKRGLYCFPEKISDKAFVAGALYAPCYISLEYALNLHGLLPDIPFAVTLVTPRISRDFTNPYGRFIYHKIQKGLFWGFDPQTLLGEREKVLLDYFYLYRHRLEAETAFWRDLRFQNTKELDFKKLKRYAAFFPEKVKYLLRSFLIFCKKWKD